MTVPLRLGLRILQVLFVCVLVAVGLPASQATAAAPDPTEDKPTLPEHCTLRPGGHMTYRAAPCYLTSFRKNRPTVVLWGDSHAWQHIPAVRPLARKHDVNLVMFMLGGCAPFLVPEHTEQTLYSCEKSNQIALRFVRKLKREDRPVRVLIGAFWQGYRDFYQRIYVDHTLDKADYPDSFLRSIRKFRKRTPRLFGELGRIGVRVDIMGQAPVVPENPPYCWQQVPYACELPRRQALADEGATTRWLGRQLAKVPARSRVIRFNDPYCDGGTCYGKVGDIYTFFDIWHLSATRTRTLKPYFRRTFTAFG